MKIAIPIWQNQVSNVFDFAGILLLVEMDKDIEISRQTFQLYGRTGIEKAAVLKQSGVEVLICGAISQPAAIWLSSAGIQVVSSITGPTEQVLDAFRAGHLNQPQFALPGCCRGHDACPGRRHRRQGRGCQQSIHDEK